MLSSGVARQIMLAQLAKGYTDASQKSESKVAFPFENIDGAGSVFSTTGDLYKLDKALKNNTLLSENATKLMHTQHIKEKYGYGWFIKESGGIWDYYYHKDDLPGCTSYFSRRIQKDQTIILLANAENLDLDELAADINKVLKGK
jgi:CubicO group peptidase (beta-lactamase class C family)